MIHCGKLNLFHTVIIYLQTQMTAISNYEYDTVMGISITRDNCLLCQCGGQLLEILLEHFSSSDAMIMIIIYKWCALYPQHICVLSAYLYIQNGVMQGVDSNMTTPSKDVLFFMLSCLQALVFSHLKN